MRLLNTNEQLFTAGGFTMADLGSDVTFFIGYVTGLLGVVGTLCLVQNVSFEALYETASHFVFDNR